MFIGNATSRSTQLNCRRDENCGETSAENSKTQQASSSISAIDGYSSPLLPGRVQIITQVEDIKDEEAEASKETGLVKGNAQLTYEQTIKILQIVEIIQKAVDKEEYYFLLENGNLMLDYDAEFKIKKLLNDADVHFLKALFGQLHSQTFSTVKRVNPLTVFLNIYPSLEPKVDRNGVLNINGVSWIINKLKEKDMIPKTCNVIISATVRQFIEKLQEMDKTPLAEEEKSQMCFVIGHRDYLASQHLSAVYVEKTPQRIEIVILDSRPSVVLSDPTMASGSYPTSMSVMRINAMAKQAIPNAEVYCYKHIRQKAGSLCPIFTILDVIEMSRTESLLAFAKRSHEDTVEGIHLFSDLPSTFLKPFEDLKLLQDIRNRNPEIEEEVVEIKKETTLSAFFLKNMASVMHKGKHKQHNLFALRKCHKIVAKIIYDNMIAG